MKIALIYFSPTNNTAKIAAVVKKKFITLGNVVIEFDITNYSERKKSLNLDQFEAFVFGFPVYYWRAPQLIREWLTTLQGNNRMCSVFFTYGGVRLGIARQDMKEILFKQNFKVISMAKFVAKHTFNLSGWRLNMDRPNKKDLKIAEEYAFQTYKQFIKEKPEILALKPQKRTTEKVDEIELMTKRAIPIPIRKAINCRMCRTCEDLCPTNAMNADKGKPNRTTCIRCFRCVANCPDNVLVTKDMSPHYEKLKKDTRLTEKIINSKKSKFYI